MERRKDSFTTKTRVNFKLPLIIQKSSLYRSVFARKRVNRTSTTPSKSHNFKLKLRLKPIVIVLAIVIIGFFVFNLTKYLSFNPQKISENELPYKMNYDNFTLLFIGLDDRVDGYEFAKLLTIVDFNINDNLAKIYTINPSFLTKKAQGYPLKTLWNNFPKDSQVTGFINELESLMAINIDNYMIFKKSDFDSLYQNEFMVSAKADYAIGDNIIKRGQSIDVSKSLDLIMENSNLSDDTLYFQQDFVKTYLEMFKSRIYSYGVFLSSDSFLSTVKTGLNRDDYLGLISNISNLDFITSTKSIMSKSLGTPTLKDIEIINPNNTLLDENLGENFRLFDVIKEQGQIEMYNASQMSGIATKYQRMAQNRGANVIKIGNHPEVTEVSKIYLNLKNMDNYKNTINLLYDLVPSSVKIFDISEFKYNYSGDIVLILGKDVIQ